MLNLGCQDDSDYFIKRTLQFQYSFQSICQNLKIPYLQFCSLYGMKTVDNKKVTPELLLFKSSRILPNSKLKMDRKFTKETLFSEIDDNHFYG